MKTFLKTIFQTLTFSRTLCLCFIFTLSACTTVPVNQENSPQGKGSALRELQKQRFIQGKNLFLNKQYAEAATVLLPLAQQGNADAQYTIGYMYHYGYGLPRHEKESTRWIATAAGHGHKLAQQALAQINEAHDKVGPISEPVTKP